MDTINLSKEYTDVIDLTMDEDDDVNKDQNTEILDGQNSEIMAVNSGGEIDAGGDRNDNIFHCKTPNCSGAFPNKIYDTRNTKIICTVCKQANCLKCKTIHIGQTCRQFAISSTVKEENNNYTRESLKKYMSRLPKNEIVAMRQNTFVFEETPKREENYNDLVDLHMSSAVQNIDQFDCSICFNVIDIGGGITLKNCLHNFCTTCLSNTIIYSEDVNVKCPFVDDNYSCETCMDESEIKYVLDGPAYEKYLAKSLKLAELNIENAIHCKLPNCTGWTIKENDGIVVFICEVCSSINCLKCEDIHTGMSCQEFSQFKEMNPTNASEKQSVATLAKMLTNGEAMRCPQCQVIVTKVSGCDAITCAACRTEICWVTKKLRRGVNGCRCKENGIKCHPNCQNCH